MKRTITYINLFGSLLIFCFATNIFDSIFMFLFFGIVPGRVDPISAQEMLAFYFSVSMILVTVILRKRLNNLPRITNLVSAS